MIRAVIVEDEMLVRLGMKISLESTGKISVVETFESGEEAVRYLTGKAVDVLITDIRLNGISGLELIRQIKPFCINLRIIVLSCYDDFTYAQEAIELGVDKYLLKQELLESQLPSLVEELCARCGQSVNLNYYAESPGEEDPFEKQEQDGIFILSYLAMRGETEIRNAGAQELDLSIVTEMLQKILNMSGIGRCYLRHGEELFIIFQFPKNQTVTQRREKIQNFYDVAKKNVRNYFNRNLYMACSKAFVDMKLVRTYFEDTRTLAEYGFYFDTSVLLLWDRFHTEQQSWPALAVDYADDMFSDSGFDRTRDKLDKFFRECIQCYAPVKEVKVQIVKFLCDYEHCLTKNYGKDIVSRIFEQDPYPNYLNIDTFDSAAQLNLQLDQMIGRIREKIAGKSLLWIRIEEYIRNHYRENLSLERIAAEFNFTPAYFSQAFKKNVGRTLVSYLNDIRINEAKKLLICSDKSAVEIAEEVGIPNFNYFVRLFKKMEGETLTEFRRNHKILK